MDAKEHLNWAIVLLSYASKIIFKIFQQYVNKKFEDVQPSFGKDRGIREQLPIKFGSRENKEFQKKKKITPASLTPLKPFPVVDNNNCGQFKKRWKYQTF